MRSEGAGVGAAAGLMGVSEERRSAKEGALVAGRAGMEGMGERVGSSARGLGWMVWGCGGEGTYQVRRRSTAGWRCRCFAAR